jgi:3-oxoacyl-[acyl-carrier protein] reductase
MIQAARSRLNGVEHFADKVVIVTGAAAGIGRATARRFAREGARVAGFDVDAEKGKTLVDEIVTDGGQGWFETVNVADACSVATGVAAVAERWGRIDVLVNNAGILRDAQLVKWKDGQLAGALSDEAWDAVIDVNLRGVFHCTRAVVPHMIQAGGGVVLNASSVVGLYGNFGQTNYVASKAGVLGMTRTWARELGRYRIRVNAVAPGYVKTEILSAMPQKILDAMVEHTPLGRIGSTEDIANAYLWLASDQASFVTGHCLSVDGGVVVGT